MDAFLSFLLLMCSVSAAQLNTESEIHAMLKEMNATLVGLKYKIRNLQRENEAQAGELVAIKTRANITEDHVDALRREGEGKKVAFSASLLASGSGTLGPFNFLTTLEFKHVFVNIGNAYNPNIGIFTAPVRGVYHFEMYIGAPGRQFNLSAVVLVKNGQHIVIAIAHQPSGYLSSANGATLLLEVGDAVFLRLLRNTVISANRNHPSTFSGHLLFTM